MHSYEDQTIIYNKITKQFNVNNVLVTYILNYFYILVRMYSIFNHSFIYFASNMHIIPCKRKIVNNTFFVFRNVLFMYAIVNS